MAQMSSSSAARREVEQLLSAAAARSSLTTPGGTVYRGRAESHLGRVSCLDESKSLGLPSTRVEEPSS